jgi:hypothetical protein
MMAMFVVRCCQEKWRELDGGIDINDGNRDEGNVRAIPTNQLCW